VDISNVTKKYKLLNLTFCKSISVHSFVRWYRITCLFCGILAVLSFQSVHRHEKQVDTLLTWHSKIFNKSTKFTSIDEIQVTVMIVKLTSCIAF